MGFYQPAQIVADARKHGVEVRPVDINYSQWDNTLEGEMGKLHTLRLGFRQIKGMGEEDAQTLVATKGNGYKSITALMDAGVPLAAMERLAGADAFRSLGIDRRRALWEISALADRPIALFEGQPSESTREVQIQLPLMTPGEHVIHDYAATSINSRALYCVLAC